SVHANGGTGRPASQGPGGGRRAGPRPPTQRLRFYSGGIYRRSTPAALVLQTTFFLLSSRGSRPSSRRNTGSVWAGPRPRRTIVRSHAGAAAGKGLAPERDRTQGPLRRRHIRRQEPGFRPSGSQIDGTIQEGHVFRVPSLVRNPDPAS